MKRKPQDNEFIKVLLVAPTSRYVGGQAVQAEALLQNWQNGGQVCMTFVPIDPLPPRLIRWSIRIKLLRTLVRTTIYLLSLLRNVPKADVVHVFSASYWSFVLAPTPAILIARFMGKKSILNYHSGEADDHFNRSPIFVKWVLKRVDLIVVQSEYLCHSFARINYWPLVIPNVTDTSQFEFHLRRRLAPHLLCTRGFEQHYDIPTVIRAFEIVKKRYTNATLTLVGTGPLEKTLHDMVTDRNLQGVTFAGAIAHRDMPKWYRENDILVNASLIDNAPVSLIEAFAAGLAVVSSNSGGIPFMAEDGRTALLSAAGDAALLAANIIRALDDSDLALRLITAARQECTKYLWTAVGPLWLAAYRTVLSSAAAEPKNRNLHDPCVHSEKKDARA